MIECIFSLDYEIYGNGRGSLRDLVLDPTRTLTRLFQNFDAPFVVFPEAVEFARMEEAGSDPDTASVRKQLRELRAARHEIGLHLHPWWANGRYEDGRWRLDWSERNLCALGPGRVQTIVSDAISYLREALGEPEFTPFCFRSGLWVMQPTAVVAGVLAHQGVRVDSSVFGGGRVRRLGLDYRAASRNGPFWRFSTDVSVPDPRGPLWEIPIHSEMVPFWEMLGRKRLQLERRVPDDADSAQLSRHWLDRLRFRHPRKLDFCRMTFEEMRAVTEGLLRDGESRAAGRVVVAIGHTKDLVDFEAIHRFLEFLRLQGIAVTTFSHALGREPFLSPIPDGECAGH